MNELIGVAFLVLATIVNISAGATIDALASIVPSMQNLMEENIAFCRVETTDAVLATGILAAIERTTTYQGGKFRYRHSIHLMVQDVVEPSLNIGNFIGKTYQQALGYLSQKDSTLRKRVEKLSLAIAPNILWQHVEHTIGYLRRRKHLIVAQISQATEHIGIIVDHGREDSDSESTDILLLGRVQRLARPCRRRAIPHRQPWACRTPHS